MLLFSLLPLHLASVCILPCSGRVTSFSSLRARLPLVGTISFPFFSVSRISCQIITLFSYQIPFGTLLLSYNTYTAIVRAATA